MDLPSNKSFYFILRKSIALAFMTYIIDLNAYELHLGDEKVFNNFINICLGFTIIYHRGSLLLKNIFVYLCYWLHMNVICLHIHTITCTFIIEIVHVSLDFTNKLINCIHGGIHGWGTTFGTKDLRTMSQWISAFIMIYHYLINKF